MTTALYARLARANVRNHRRIYLPYILTCVGMAAMFYIVCFLSTDRGVGSMHGGTQLQVLLSFGVGVVAVFAAIFLFYTNSFLMKCRKLELGLYNALGMGKRHIARVMLWEAGYMLTVCLAGGLAAGILLSKLAQLVMMKLLAKTADFDFRVSPFALTATAVLLVVVFTLLLLNNLRQVRAASPAELMRSGRAGEREPKANYVLAVLGVLLLGAGYWLALTVTDPIAALGWFFAAVILVILGTYLLFISGSVAILKLLRRNKRYYYRTNHFVSVSGMFYRMKRNGAGLASICILSTMVLVMISSTTCLYVGMDDAMRLRHPRDVDVTLALDAPEVPVAVGSAVDKALSEAGLKAENRMAYRSLSFSARLTGEELKLDMDGFGKGFCRVFVVPAEDFVAATGQALNLTAGEAAVYASGVSVGARLTIGDMTYRVLQAPAALETSDWTIATAKLYMFMPDEDMRALYALQKQAYGDNASRYAYYAGFNLPSADRATQSELVSAIGTALDGVLPNVNIAAAALEWDEMISMYGGLLFLGLMLGLTFVLAAVLIMYYKQVTEGLEDSGRFDILMKVGMTPRETRATIHSQVLTVFALPLIAAAVHMVFAFPMVEKLLMLFGLFNASLFAIVTCATIVLFGLFYAAAYLVTSRAYLSIVGGAARA